MPAYFTPQYHTGRTIHVTGFAKRKAAKHKTRVQLQPSCKIQRLQGKLPFKMLIQPNHDCLKNTSTLSELIRNHDQNHETSLG